MKFEEVLKQLEEIVVELEKGELSLDESLAKYEDGIRIYRKSLKLLEKAEGRLKVFARDGEGRLLVEDLPEGPPDETDSKE